MIRKATVVLALAIALGGPSAARAHFAGRQRSISSRCETSEVVVRGVIERAEQTFEAGHSRRRGKGAIRVEEVLKGEAPRGGSLAFETAGVHQPRYRAGEHVLLFLSRVPASTPARLVTRQSAIEAVDLDGADGAAVLAAVRGYLEISRIADPALRRERLKGAILAELDSPSALLWEDGVFDLSRRTDLPLDDADVSRLGRLALRGDAAPVLRVGCIAKLGALGKQGRDAAARALATVVVSPGELVVRTMAAAALADTRSPAARPALVRALTDPAAPLRRAAADALGRLGERSAVDPLCEAAADDPDGRVRFAAVKAIARIGGPHAEATLGALPGRSRFTDAVTAVELAHREVSRQRREEDGR
jgi:HEAT repeat protein